jgi:DNA replication and repair protein RecF
VRVSRLRLEAFRNHSSTDVTLDKGVSVFVGNNGQGKTNIVESLGYLSTLSSHRVSSDDAMVQSGQSHAIIRADIHAAGRSVDVMMTINSVGANKARVNDAPASLADAASWTTTVFFSPEDLSIIRSDPSFRRRFVDGVLIQSSPRIAGTFGEYDKVLKQRNMLLKTLRNNPRTQDAEPTMAVWDDMLVTLSTDITQARWRLLDNLSPLFSSSYGDIRPGHDVGLELHHSSDLLSDLSPDMSQSDVMAVYRQALQAVRASERDRGMTLVGPHRDDVVISLNGLPARTHSSQGEAWSSALALKLATARYHRDTSSSGDPIVILDDVFAELDDNRRQALAAAVGGWEQVLITAAVPGDVPEVLSGHFIEVSGGQIVH